LLLFDGRNLDLRSCAVDDVLDDVLMEALSDWRDFERVGSFLETLSIAADVRRVEPALSADPENIVAVLDGYGTVGEKDVWMIGSAYELL